MLLVVVNVFLISQNRQLRKSLENSKQFVLDEGYRFAELAIKRKDGGEELVNLADQQRNTLLLVFNSNCRYCDQQYPYWNELIRGLDPSDWKVLAISSEGNHESIESHLEKWNLEGAMAGRVTLDVIKKTRMLFTPMTIVIDKEGEVRKVWPGLWTKGFDIRF